MLRVRACVLIFVCVAFFPIEAWAQAAIAGVVRDTSGAVLPGVTVEAASAALIEKVRTATTDGAGQFRIADLRPGTYAVTFSLPGFSTVRREGIELTGTFIATVNADMRVGTLEETVTVTGESPVVDVRNAQSEARIDDEVVSAIPTGRQYYSLAALVPSIATQGADVGASAGPAFAMFRNRGGSSDEGQLQVSGFPTGWQGQGVSYYVADLGAAEEVTFALTGGLGEYRVSGPIMNVVPRSGGNQFRGSVYANGAGGGMEGSNFTQAHRDAGLRAPNQLDKIWDVNANLGGPIMQNRLWFFANGRHQGNRKTIAGVWANKNAGNPNSWTYDPDFDKQATDTGTWKQVATRLTFQASMRDRISFYWDEQSVCRLCLGGEGTATSAPEGTPTNQGFPQKHVHATWTAPFTSRWLAETGFGLNTVQWGGVAKEPQDTTDLIRVVEQGGVIPGIAYRSTNWSRPFGYSAMWRGSLSYITGSHSVKFGYEGNYFWNRAMSHTNTQLLEYRFNNGVPNQLTMTLTSPIVTQMYERDHSFYAQDQWTRGRLSLQAGFRVEHITSAYPEQRIERSKFLPQDIVFPAQDSPVNLNDIAPRMGVAYDLFGTGRTALKGTLGRYASEPVGERYVAPYNPVTRLVTSNPRAWIDQDRDFVPDCDLLNPAAQSPATTGSVDTCGASNPLFGQNRPATVYDADLITGWNKRFQNWDLSAAVRHELFPRVGIEVEYMRRVFGNFRINDNRAVGPQDFDEYSVVVPTDPRLPLSGQTLTGLYNVKPDKFNLTDNFVTFADKYGKQIRHYDGMSLNVTARPANGVTAQGGFSFGRLLEDNCELASELPELFQPGNGAAVDGAYAANTGVRSTDFCHLTTPLMPQYTGLATYTIPRVLLQVSGTLTSKRLLGVRNTNHNAVFVESLAANLVATNAQIQSSLGRPLSGGQQVVTINLAEPGTLYNDRITTMDFRVARVQRFGNRRLLVGLDVYNIGNSGAVVGYNQTYGPSFLTPTAILQARFAKISAQLDF